MQSQDMADNAIKNLNNSLFNGANIVVERGRMKERKPNQGPPSGNGGPPQGGRMNNGGGGGGNGGGPNRNGGGNRNDPQNRAPGGNMGRGPNQGQMGGFRGTDSKLKVKNVSCSDLLMFIIIFRWKQDGRQ